MIAYFKVTGVRTSLPVMIAYFKVTGVRTSLPVINISERTEHVIG